MPQREDKMAQQKIEETKVNKLEQFKLFLKESKEELGRVVWPEKKVVVNATWVVLAITIIVAGVLGVIDLIYTNIIKLIFS
jgi:preprotein translocase subunit SecE